ncbi:MAG: GNAT family N-acetyltransferase, partial [Massilia sp.]|nr:GNAT family N-acetyltransferase [Massilia sp.]
MNKPLTIRPIEQADRSAWEILWAGYNAFYERSGPTALAPQITQATWERFFDPAEPVFALVAQQAGQVVGLTHYLFHRSTSRIEPVCYLQDLFTAPEMRGHG